MMEWAQCQFWNSYHGNQYSSHSNQNGRVHKLPSGLGRSSFDMEHACSNIENNWRVLPVEVDHRDEWKAYSSITATTGMSHY